jgi:hypothetical protein
VTDQFSNDRILDAQRQGYEAYRRGERLTANPYGYYEQTDQCVAWGRGWAAARTDKIRLDTGANTVLPPDGGKFVWGEFDIIISEGDNQ